MKYRIVYLSSILLLIFQGLSAQTDSATFVSANWVKMNVAPGITLSRFYFGDNSLFSSNQNICLLEVNPTITKIDIVGDTKLRTTTSFAEQYDAEAAVNGSFFDMEASGKPYNSVEYLRIDGEDKAPVQLLNGKRDFFQEGVFAIDNGKPYILKADVIPNWELIISAEDAIGTGPLLRIDSKDEVLKQISFNKNRHPRTVAIKISNTRFIFMVVDGRFPEAQGMSLFEVQQVVRWLGATDAINFDGGGSSAMFVRTNNTEENIVNHPSDNKKYDNKGERIVANAIIINTLE